VFTSTARGGNRGEEAESGVHGAEYDRTLTLVISLPDDDGTLRRNLLLGTEWLLGNKDWLLGDTDWLLGNTVWLLGDAIWLLGNG
jgi:hypothetical protein